MTRVGSLLRAACPPFLKQFSYRLPMRVSEIHVFPYCHRAAYPACPRCRRTMEREYTAFCSRCGQKLDWRHYQQARIVHIRKIDRDMLR